MDFPGSKQNSWPTSMVKFDLVDLMFFRLELNHGHPSLLIIAIQPCLFGVVEQRCLGVNHGIERTNGDQASDCWVATCRGHRQVGHGTAGGGDGLRQDQGMEDARDRANTEFVETGRSFVETVHAGPEL